MKTITLEADLKKLTTALGRTVPDKVKRTAAKRAGNKATRTARAKISREIRSKVAISSADAKEAIKGGKLYDSGGAFSWTLVLSGEQLKAVRFKHSATKTGVKFKYYKRGWTKYDGGFIATMPKSGHTGLFTRQGRQASRRVKHRVKTGQHAGQMTNKALRIKEIFAPPLSQVYKETGRAKTIQAGIKEDFEAEYLRLVKVTLEKAKA